MTTETAIFDVRDVDPNVEYDVNGLAIVDDEETEFFGAFGADQATQPILTTTTGTTLTDTHLWIDATGATDGTVWTQTQPTPLDVDIKISHKFRWVKEGDKKVLQCHEDGEWINIPFIEDPDAEKFTDEINDLCSMD